MGAFGLVDKRKRCGLESLRLTRDHCLNRNCPCPSPANDPMLNVLQACRVPTVGRRHCTSFILLARRKTASRAAVHREETDRLAVVKHSRMLPPPAPTSGQRCTASLSHLRTILFANATHRLESFSWSFWRHSSMLFARTGTPPHCFATSLPQATATSLFFVLLVCA